MDKKSIDYKTRKIIVKASQITRLAAGMSDEMRKKAADIVIMAAEIRSRDEEEKKSKVNVEGASVQKQPDA